MTLEEVKKSFETLYQLVGELYVHECTGGPLHIITDDGNVRDSDLVFCYRWLHTHKYSRYIELLCKSILHELALMTRAQRVVWWNRKLIGEQGLDPIALAVEVENGIVEDHIEAGNYYITSSQLPPKILWNGWHHECS